MTKRRRLYQIITIVIVQALTLMLLTAVLPGLAIESWISAFVVAGVLILVQAFYWWAFVTFLAWLPVWLYPILTFVISGGLVFLVSNFISGVTVDGIGTGIWISLTLTAVNAILGGLLSIDMDERFDINVTQKLVKRRGQITETDIPGFVFLEIDGLGEKIFRRALAEGYMPTLKRWLDEGSHTITGWETELTAQTGAMQPGILLGNNAEIPAYRWWNRKLGRLEMSNNPLDSRALEARLSTGRGLLSDGGASRGNMFSGDASESLMTYSTLLNRERASSPGFYLYLLSPYVVARLFTHYFGEVLKEWWQAAQQKRRKDPYIVKSRNTTYAFLRAFLGSFMQDLITYTVIGDVLRGVPALYALYASYDDVSHFAGMETPEAFETLEQTDHYFARIERALKQAPRPYHIVILCDHGQSIGPTFKAAYGLSLEEIVKGVIQGDKKIFASLNTNEAWDNISALFNESVNAKTRTARVLRTALRSKVNQDGMVAVGPERDPNNLEKAELQPEEANIVVLASGCSGLINFTDAQERLTYEEIQARHPDLIPALVSHPGVGFVLVRSAKDGDLVLGKEGIHFLKDDTVEGVDPLAVYSPNAARHLKLESSYENCPDLLVNTQYDPVTEVICGFEDQVSHHGGLGGPQNFGFIFHPKALSAPDEPIIASTGVYKLMRGWREQVQGLEPAKS
ncbi:MAG TPA: hypothetical protein DEH25_06255 [Chloroflexi bacterium]|nr:hypothetical protein [Chloroflexota bacterium]HBY06553.1 hypothetical protein [Chloroflexota bacterium]